METEEEDRTFENESEWRQYDGGMLMALSVVTLTFTLLLIVSIA